MAGVRGPREGPWWWYLGGLQAVLRGQAACAVEAADAAMRGRGAQAVPGRRASGQHGHSTREHGLLPLGGRDEGGRQRGRHRLLLQRAVDQVHGLKDSSERGRTRWPPRPGTRPTYHRKLASVQVPILVDVTEVPDLWGTARLSAARAGVGGCTPPSSGRDSPLQQGWWWADCR